MEPGTVGAAGRYAPTIFESDTSARAGCGGRREARARREDGRPGPRRAEGGVRGRARGDGGEEAREEGFRVVAARAEERRRAAERDALVAGAGREARADALAQVDVASIGARGRGEPALEAARARSWEAGAGMRPRHSGRAAVDAELDECSEPARQSRHC